MGDSGLLIGWKRVIPGREDQAVAMWHEMLSFFRRLHAEGRVGHFDPVLLGAHGGALNGFILVRGDKDKLDRLRSSEEFMMLNVRANKTLEDFLVVRAHFGAEADAYIRMLAAS